MRLHTIADYWTERVDRIEEYEQNIAHAYLDPAGIPTIGIGLNLRVHRWLIFEALGFDVRGTILTGQALTAERDYIARLQAAIDRAYPAVQNTSLTNAVLVELENILDERADDVAGVYTNFPNVVREREFRLAAGAEYALLTTVFIVGYDIPIPPPGGGTSTFTDYETQLDNWLNESVGGSSVAETTPSLLARDSNERLALFSLLFNSRLDGNGDPVLLGNQLRAALISDNRAEAWFQIRYRSNALGNNFRNGIATRRYKESDLFGLYNADPTEADYIAVSAFDAALVADPGLTTWALTNALVAQHLSGSDTAAIGGDLSYRYGRFDTLSDISFTPALALLAAAGFGTSAQTLQSLGSLQDSSARLS